MAELKAGRKFQLDNFFSGLQNYTSRHLQDSKEISLQSSNNSEKMGIAQNVVGDKNSANGLSRGYESQTMTAKDSKVSERNENILRRRDKSNSHFSNHQSTALSSRVLERAKQGTWTQETVQLILVLKTIRLQILNLLAWSPQIDGQ